MTATPDAQASDIEAARLRLKWANLALLVAWPIAWTAPLAHAGLLPWFDGTAVSVLGGMVDLWEVDRALSLLVGLFAMVMPAAKTLALAALHSGRLGPGALPAIDVLGKLSMAEVFLLALYIVVVKGVGLGHVSTGWGLWFFTACVLGQLWISIATKRRWAST